MPSMLSGFSVLTESQEEKRRIEGSFDNVWLSDTKIDATHAVLRQQFPYEEGMQSAISAAKLRHSNILYMSHARARLHVYMHRM